MSPSSAGPVLSTPGVAAQPEARPHLTPVSRSPAEATLDELHARLTSHPFWNHRLLQACRRGQLLREDYALIFSQYALLTRSATRFVHALLAQCESETWCARLTQALWEEVGAQPPERRPSTLFRRFLRDGLGVDVESIRFQDATRYFVRECLDTCLRAPPAVASAFLALGLEALVPRLYSIFVGGLHQAGVADRYLPFFYWHMEASPARRSTLEELTLSHAHEPGWDHSCLRAMERALELHGNFLDHLYEAVQRRRLGPLLEAIEARLPLAPEAPDPRTVHLGDVSNVIPFYRHAHEAQGIDFSVDRVPFPAQVLETHLVRVAPGCASEPREHAHEVLLVVLSGTGRVHVRGTAVEVKPGDAVFVPRWACHHARGTGPEVLTLLTVTDHGLTRRALEEELLRAAKLKREVGVDP